LTNCPSGISVSEHIFYKRGFSGYDPTIYMDAKKLPPGIAAVVAFAFGIMGAILGMAQVWLILDLSWLSRSLPLRIVL
jgi:purine-cytosine permease-like protein